VALEE